jgi:hypothetical protein
MSAAVDQLARGGIARAEDVVRIAAATGLELASACAMLEMESSGGFNIWGRDGVDTGGLYIKGTPVTEASYRAYRSAVTGGRIGHQGVGPCQLTAEDYQARADALGGAHDPLVNMRVGFETLASHQRRYGTRGGFVAYNGGGGAVRNALSPAQAYGDRAMTKRAKWLGYLAGLDTSAPAGADGEDDMPLSNDDLAKIRDIVWQAPIPDYYAPNLPAQPAFAMLGWGATHAANARDRAIEARDSANGARDAASHTVQLASALQSAIGSVAAPDSPVADLDYRAFARALLAEMAAPSPFPTAGGTQ